MRVRSNITGKGFSERRRVPLTSERFREIKQSSDFDETLRRLGKWAREILREEGLPDDLREVLWRQRNGQSWRWEELPPGWDDALRSGGGSALEDGSNKEEREQNRERRALEAFRRVRRLVKAAPGELVVETSVSGAVGDILPRESREAYAALILRYVSRDIPKAIRNGYQNQERNTIFELGQLVREWNLKPWEKLALGPRKGLDAMKEQLALHNKRRQQEADHIRKLVCSEDDRLQARHPDFSDAARARILHGRLAKEHDIHRSERTIRRYLSSRRRRD